VGDAVELALNAIGNLIELRPREVDKVLSVSHRIVVVADGFTMD
jgi:hypothetical protein